MIDVAQGATDSPIRIDSPDPNSIHLEWDVDKRNKFDAYLYLQVNSYRGKGRKNVYYWRKNQWGNTFCC
ncbi:hypothetical protein DSCO28_24790 [Desulfosarcina ovata subsp. sediminis]|uniref:Uncharacterized protein n=1 Tax=Desulfosarcina ovata subsp. sediminis TaxID=885957 RepID=A0A5K7ZRK2_9BACT|nr:hypothetical protein DSCO28_24790 [Desulfosarcina ovata subsp. sediminis]